jgi:hypothetical protein
VATACCRIEYASSHRLQKNNNVVPTMVGHLDIP